MFVIVSHGPRIGDGPVMLTLEVFCMWASETMADVVDVSHKIQQGHQADIKGSSLMIDFRDPNQGVLIFVPRIRYVEGGFRIKDSVIQFAYRSSYNHFGTLILYSITDATAESNQLWRVEYRISDNICKPILFMHIQKLKWTDVVVCIFSYTFIFLTSNIHECIFTEFKMEMSYFKSNFFSSLLNADYALVENLRCKKYRLLNLDFPKHDLVESLSWSQKHLNWFELVRMESILITANFNYINSGTELNYKYKYLVKSGKQLSVSHLNIIILSLN